MKKPLYRALSLFLLCAVSEFIRAAGVFLKRTDSSLMHDPIEFLKSKTESDTLPISTELPPRSESSSASSLTGPSNYSPDSEADPNHQYYQSEQYKNDKLAKAGKLSNAPADVLKRGLDKSAPEMMIPDELAELMLPIFPVNNPSAEKMKDPDTEQFVKVEDCNAKWDYDNDGQDWNCKCSVGERQSPINLQKNISKKLTHNVRLEFTTLQTLNLDRPPQIIKNTGRTLKIDYELGDLYLFPKLTHYEGKQIHFHVQSEHALDGYFYDMEMHLVYTLAELDRTGLAIDSKPILILSVLFDAACTQDLSSKFLDSLDLDHIPQNKMETIDFPKHLDFNLLFDEDANAYRYRCDPAKRKKGRDALLIEDQERKRNGANSTETQNERKIEKTSFKEMKADSIINKQNNTIFFNDDDIQKIQDFLDYNPIYPVGSFYTYNGSLTTPSCDEIVTYIVKAEPVTASLDQIKKIAAAIEKGGAIGGNHRALQLPFNREVFLYEKLDHKEFMDFLKDTKTFSYPARKETSYFYVDSAAPSGIKESFIVDEQEIPNNIKKLLKPN